MIRNFFITAYRVLIRDKGFSFINILGFSIGIACSILIFMWVNDELTFDSQHKNGKRIFRVIANVPSGEERLNVAVTPALLAPSLREEYPDIEEATSFKSIGSTEFRVDGKIIEERGAAIGQSDLFSIFSFSFLEGNPQTCLDNPNSIVITEDLARKYFGNESAIGKELDLVGLGFYNVSAVIEDVSHCHFQFNYILPFEIAKTLFNDNLDEMGTYNYTTYIMLREGVNPDLFRQKISDFMDKYDEEGDDQKEDKLILFIQNLKDIYLKSDFAYDFIQKGDINNIYIFSFIAIIILVIASINFMNLSTARSANRSREIGLRKVVGGKRKHIISQFYIESALVTIPGFIFALIFVELLTPWFSNLAGKDFSQNIFSNPTLVIYYLASLIVITFLSGSYPALYLSSFIPVKVLKGDLAQGASSGTFRKVLVIFQFSITIILLVATIVIDNQLTYIRSRDLGYDKEQLIQVFKSKTINKKYDVFKSRLLQSPYISDVTSISNPFIYAGPSAVLNEWDGNIGEEYFRLHFQYVDYDFINTMGIEMLEGRSFSKDFHDDSAVVYLVNETAKKKLGMDQTVGSHMTFLEKEGKILGVFKDFNYNTLHNKIDPLVVILDNADTRYAMIRVEKEGVKNALQHLEQVWKELEPEHEIFYAFVDERLDSLYRTEQRTGKIFRYFAFFAIFISCLGLFGLASFMTEQRRKEIGVRKVLGSGVFPLIYLLTWEFVKWVLLAGLIGLPLAYYFSIKWLEGFYYRTDISVMPYALAILIAIIVAIFTVSFKTFRAAVKNPVDSIKYE